MSQTMFERYGGFAVVSKVVMALYDKVLESDVAGPYFDGVDVRGVIDHQTKFISQLMGGPAAYTDHQLQELHASLGVTDAAFDEVIELLRETLEDFELESSDVDHIMGDMEARRRIITVVGGPDAKHPGTRTR